MNNQTGNNRITRINNKTYIPIAAVVSILLLMGSVFAVFRGVESRLVKIEVTYNHISEILGRNYVPRHELNPRLIHYDTELHILRTDIKNEKGHRCMCSIR